MLLCLHGRQNSFVCVQRLCTRKRSYNYLYVYKRFCANAKKNVCTITNTHTNIYAKSIGVCLAEISHCNTVCLQHITARSTTTFNTMRSPVHYKCTRARGVERNKDINYYYTCVWHFLIAKENNNKSYQTHFAYTTTTKYVMMSNISSWRHKYVILNVDNSSVLQ